MPFLISSVLWLLGSVEAFLKSASSHTQPVGSHRRFL
jgi:hypothetical protein